MYTLYHQCDTHRHIHIGRIRKNYTAMSHHPDIYRSYSFHPILHVKSHKFHSNTDHSFLHRGQPVYQERLGCPDPLDLDHPALLFYSRRCRQIHGRYHIRISCLCYPTSLELRRLRRQLFHPHTDIHICC